MIGKNGWIPMAFAFGLAFAAPAKAADANVVADATYYARLTKPANWASGNGGTYYKFNTTDSLPNQAKKTWGTVTDHTRVGDGQCVAFVRAISNSASVTSDKWLKGLDVVDSSNHIIPVAGSTVLATFGADKRYSPGHCLVVLSRNGDSLLVAEQNVLTGVDQAKVVSKREIAVAGLKKYSIVTIK